MNAPRFSPTELAQVQKAEQEALDLVRGFYVLAPRELGRIRYRVCTLDELEPMEVVDGALAHVLCYQKQRWRGDRALDPSDIYRICLQDDRILDLSGEFALEPMLLYLLTHELIHVVRFGTALQRIDLPTDLRFHEEARVDRTARLILSRQAWPGLRPVLENLPPRYDA